jgi:hypothetical protein
MPWVTPTTVSTGDVLQAATWNQSVVANSLMGNPVFTNEAARDAAISSPVEGQRCYLTASTVATATGGITLIPSGIQTIYNGSAWVCVTPVASRTDSSGTTTSTSYTVSLSGSPGTNPSVTLSTGTTAIIHVALSMSISSTASTAITSVAVSGATTAAAADNNSLFHNLTNAHYWSRIIVFSGLTAGTNTFTLNYRVSGNTGTFDNRQIMAYGIA